MSSNVCTTHMWLADVCWTENKNVIMKQDCKLLTYLAKNARTADVSYPGSIISDVINAVLFFHISLSNSSQSKVRSNQYLVTTVQLLYKCCSYIFFPSSITFGHYTTGFELKAHKCGYTTWMKQSGYGTLLVSIVSWLIYIYYPWILSTSHKTQGSCPCWA